MNLLKNPIFWGFVLFAGGMGVGAWGWSRYESTTAEGARFSVPLIVIGITMIVTGAIIFFTAGNSKSDK